MSENITRTKEMDLRSRDYDFISPLSDGSNTISAGEVISIDNTPGTNQVHANDVDGAPDTAAGTATMNLTDGNAIDTDFYVAFAGTETVDEAAAAIVSAFNENVTLAQKYTASVDGTDDSIVLITANAPAADDASLALTVSDADGTGLTIAASTGDDVAGVAGSVNSIGFTFADAGEDIDGNAVIEQYTVITRASQVKALKAAEAITAGTPVYWDPDNNVVTKVSDTGHIGCGQAIENATLSDDYVLINFDGRSTSSES